MEEALRKVQSAARGIILTTEIQMLDLSLLLLMLFEENET